MLLLWGQVFQVAPGESGVAVKMAIFALQTSREGGRRREADD